MTVPGGVKGSRVLEAPQLIGWPEDALKRASAAEEAEAKAVLPFAPPNRGRSGQRQLSRCSPGCCVHGAEPLHLRSVRLPHLLYGTNVRGREARVAAMATLTGLAACLARPRLEARLLSLRACRRRLLLRRTRPCITL